MSFKLRVLDVDSSVDDIRTNALSCALIKDIRVVARQLARDATETPGSTGLVHQVERIHPYIGLYVLHLNAD